MRPPMPSLLHPGRGGVRSGQRQAKLWQLLTPLLPLAVVGGASAPGVAAEHLRLWQERTRGENLALNRPVGFATPPDYPRTMAGGTDQQDLTDGRLSSLPDQVLMFDSKAVGWFTTGTHGINLLIDLGEVQPVEKAVIRLYGGARFPNQILPRILEALVSEDGKTFYRTSTLTKLMPGEKSQSDWKSLYYLPESGKPFVYPFVLAIETKARFVGLRITGHSDFVFSDELAIMKGDFAVDQCTYEEKDRTPFFMKGLVFRPIKKTMYISTNVNTPNFFAAKDLRSDEGRQEGKADDGQWIIEVPEEIELLRCPQDQNLMRESFAEEGLNRTRLILPQMPGWRSSFYFQVSPGKAFPADAAAVFYGIAAGCEPNRVRVPLKAITIPEVPLISDLHISLAWTVISEELAYPDFFKAWRHLGFNTVTTFPRYWVDPENREGYWNGKVTEDKQEFLARARALGFKVLHNESPFRVLHGKRKQYPEVLSRLPGGKTGNMCPSYRGEYYWKEIKRIGDCFVMTDPAYVFYDIELWHDGANEAGRCERCLEACTKSGKDMEAFLYDQGTEMFRHYREEIKRRCDLMQREMPVIASYNHHAVHPQHHGVIDFFQAYPRYIDLAQPSLYVRGDPLAVHNSIRKNYESLKKSRILPWLTAGCYGEFDPAKIEPMVYESFLNGSCGITYYAFFHFDTPLDFYYHAKALATIAPYEKFIARARPIALDAGSEGLTSSALVGDGQMMILLANYTGGNVATGAVTLPFAETIQVRDLLAGRDMPPANPIRVRVATGGISLLWARGAEHEAAP